MYPLVNLGVAFIQQCISIAMIGANFEVQNQHYQVNQSGSIIFIIISVKTDTDMSIFMLFYCI